MDKLSRKREERRKEIREINYWVHKRRRKSQQTGFTFLWKGLQQFSKIYMLIQVCLKRHLL